MDVVYAVDNRMVTDPKTGVQGRVQGGSHWPADDPVVKANPDLFSPDPRYGLAFSVEPEGWDAPVEQVTRAPGERRTTRRG